MDYAKCNKYIMISSASVYPILHTDIKEDEFSPQNSSLIWCDNNDFEYGELKRQAESALFQKYLPSDPIAVRFPFVIGKDDYTNRLYFYVDNIVNGRPINIDNIECDMSFINSDEAGDFLAFLSRSDFCGTINASNSGVISIKNIVDYVAKRTGKSLILSREVPDAPYNKVPKYSISTERSKSLGFSFTPIKDWIYNLLDFYIGMATS